MREKQRTLKRRGVRIACVVQGDCDEARRYCGQWKALTCVPDPERKSYRAMHLKRGGLKEVLTGKDARRRGRQAIMSGFRAGLRGSLEKHSDWYQLPGAALVAQGGEILWLHRGASAGDLPDGDELVEVVKEHLAEVEA